MNISSSIMKKNWWSTIKKLKNKKSHDFLLFLIINFSAQNSVEANDFTTQPKLSERRSLRDDSR